MEGKLLYTVTEASYDTMRENYDPARINAVVRRAKGHSQSIKNTRHHTVNLDTLERETLAGGALRMAHANGVGVDEDRRIAWTFIGRALVAIDLVSGDHVIISR
jgi:hypothetical protein